MQLIQYSLANLFLQINVNIFLFKNVFVLLSDIMIIDLRHSRG
jgi:hypothetical protein